MRIFCEVMIAAALIAMAWNKPFSEWITGDLPREQPPGQSARASGGAGRHIVFGRLDVGPGAEERARSTGLQPDPHLLQSHPLRRRGGKGILDRRQGKTALREVKVAGGGVGYRLSVIGYRG